MWKRNIHNRYLENYIKGKPPPHSPILILTLTFFNEPVVISGVSIMRDVTSSVSSVFNMGFSIAILLLRPVTAATVVCCADELDFWSNGDVSC